MYGHCTCPLRSKVTLLLFWNCQKNLPVFCRTRSREYEYKILLFFEWITKTIFVIRIQFKKQFCLFEWIQNQFLFKYSRIFANIEGKNKKIEYSKTKIPIRMNMNKLKKTIFVFEWIQYSIFIRIYSKFNIRLRVLVFCVTVTISTLFIPQKI